MKRIMILFILLIHTPFLFSQNSQLLWQQCFGGSESDKARDIINVNSDLFILGGTVSNDGDISYNHGDGDVWLIKTDSIGTIIWEKTYGGSSGEIGHRIFTNNYNGFYILARTGSVDGDISYNPFPNTTCFWILKLDIDGNILWEKVVGGNGGDEMFTGTTTNDGGIVAIGWSGSEYGDVSINYGLYDMWIIKLNSEGEIEWDFTLGTDWQDYGQAIIQTLDGGFLVGGTSKLTGGGNLDCENHGQADAVLIKLDSLRNIEWQQCYGGSDYDGTIGLLEIEDGYIFSAYAGSNDGDISGWHGEDDIWLVKIDFFGNIVWQNPLGGSRYEFAKNIFQTTNGDFIVVGSTQSNNGDVSGNHSIGDVDNDIWIIKVSSEGELLSQQCIGGQMDERMDFGVVKKSDNNFVIAAQTDYGPSYDVQCTPQSLGKPDFWVFEIKDTTIGIFDTPVIKDNVRVYPNPARDYVVFEIAKPAQGKIIIMDVLGQVISTFPLGKDKEIWDTREIKSGVYFYTLIISGFNKSGKIVISK